MAATEAKPSVQGILWGDRVKLKRRCGYIEDQLPISNEEIFANYMILGDYPWVDKTTHACNMYACLYALALTDRNIRVLEIGTGWGISGLMWGRLGGLVSLDRGGFEGGDNVSAARKLWADNEVESSLHQVNTQLHTFQWPDPYAVGQPWVYNLDLIDRLHDPFDVLFVDGDHGDENRPWALFNDLWQFWPFLKPGGLCICDDMHDPGDYPAGRFPWLGYTWASFHRFEEMMDSQIADRYIWKYPYVPSGHRPVGLLRKVYGPELVS